MCLETARLQLRHWREADRDEFAALHADLEVNADLGGPFSRQKSDKKFARYINAQTKQGYSRWVVDSLNGDFLGYAGIMRISESHPLGLHNEIGWRFHRAAWGKGYASEAAKAALDDGFKRLGLEHILSYTSLNNRRSQAVMERIGMARAEEKDFTAQYEGFGAWQGIV
ncbi:GNAT family N-acetyltransferase [Hellea balneolensis]|uniref:GNAT family N-acetyltransferase n=1 Tax=Hellea balneolensis TaxID=287478 RepID=UPI0003FF4C91|nr:GNAT family N-acetyltransferase [Hellea balneolensis]